MTIEVIGTKLLYKPKDSTPKELVEEFRQHKADLPAYLNAEGGRTSLPTEAEALLTDAVQWAGEDPKRWGKLVRGLRRT